MMCSIQTMVVPRAWIEKFVLVVAPFAPHVGEELWQRLGHDTSLTYEGFPAFDEAVLAVETESLAVQVNGKLRGSIEITPDMDKDAILAAARADAKIAAHFEGKSIVREIYVPGRLVNIVAK